MRSIVLLVCLAFAPNAFAGRAKRKVTPAAPQKPRACERVILEEVDYKDVRLVGIVSQGGRQRALVMDAQDEGHIVKPGQCVGKERVPFETLKKQLLPRKKLVAAR